MGYVSVIVVFRTYVCPECLVSQNDRYPGWLHGFGLGRVDKLFYGYGGILFCRKTLLSVAISGRENDIVSCTCGDNVSWGSVFGKYIQYKCIVCRQDTDACDLYRSGYHSREDADTRPE